MVRSCLIILGKYQQEPALFLYCPSPSSSPLDYDMQRTMMSDEPPYMSVFISYVGFISICASFHLSSSLWIWMSGEKIWVFFVSFERTYSFRTLKCPRTVIKLLSWR